VTLDDGHDSPATSPEPTSKPATAPLSRSWALILPFLKPIANLILDPDISEIMVNGTDGSVFVEKAGEITLTGLSLPQPSLLAGVKSIARNLGDDISETQPILDARLDDGSRVAAVIPPVSLGGITLTIRKFSAKHFTLEDLISRNSITREAADILVSAVAGRRNMLISGGTGTGKTTLLNILAAAIPPEDRVLLIEDTAEIQIKVPNLVRFEAKRPRPGYDGTPIRALLKAALRHRPDRIIVGEIRDGSAYDLLQALNTGHSGSMSTVHADSASGALQRFASLVLESGVEVPWNAIKANIGDALHYLVQIERRHGQRYVAEILQLDGYDPDIDRYKTRSLYTRSH
jgi:pilus assembly protein CpaF